MNDLYIKMNHENWEEVCQIIFSSCDPKGLGDIPVYHLIAYIQKEMQKVYDRSLLEELELMLLSPPGMKEFTIGKETFSTIMKAWVSYVQECNISLTDAQCDDSQFDDYLIPISHDNEILSDTHLESSSDIQKSLEQQLTDMEKQRNSLLAENTRLGNLVKEHEEALQTLTVEHNNLKDSFNILDKKLQVYKDMKKEFEELEITCKNQQSIITKLESQLKFLKKEFRQLEKSNSSLQKTVVNLKEERCKAIKDLENSRTLLGKAKSDILHMNQEFEDVVSKNDSEKIVLSEQVRDLISFTSDLKSTVEIYKEKNLYLEENLLKFKSAHHNSSSMLTSFDDSLNDINESTNLLCSEEECLRNIQITLSLHDELQASGDMGFSQKKLETELLAFHKKLKNCKVELTECQNSVNFMTSTLMNVTKLLKWINNNIDEYDLIPEKITKVVGDKLSGSSKPVVLDFIFEIEQLSRMVSQIMKKGSYKSRNNPEQLFKNDNTTQTFCSCCTGVSKCIQSDVHCWFQILPEQTLKKSPRMKLGHEHYCCSIADQIIEASHKNNGVLSTSTAVMTLASHTKALTKCENCSDSLIGSTVPDDTSVMEVKEANSSIFRSYCKLQVTILKNLFTCILYFNYYLVHIVKLLMLLLTCGIFYVLIMNFIFECSRPYGCGFNNIEEFLSPYIRLRHYAPPPV